MKSLLFKRMIMLLSIILGVGLPLFGISDGLAQEKRKLSYALEKTNYTQQYVLDVGDVPGHQVRLYEIHRTWPKNPPAFDGVPARDEWMYCYSDYTDINGRSWGYHHYVLENGDKVFARFDGTSQTVVTPDGAKKSMFTAVITLTGGTGKFRGIQGLARLTANFDYKANFEEGHVEGEYWIAK